MKILVCGISFQSAQLVIIFCPMCQAHIGSHSCTAFFYGTYIDAVCMVTPCPLQYGSCIVDLGCDEIPRDGQTSYFIIGYAILLLSQQDVPRVFSTDTCEKFPTRCQKKKILLHDLHKHLTRQGLHRAN